MNNTEPNYQRISQLEEELGIVEPPKNKKRVEGKPVIKKYRNIKEDIIIPQRQTKEIVTDISSSKHLQLRVPGKVSYDTSMRIIDAIKRGVVSREIVSDIMEIEGVKYVDCVIISPESTLSTITGYYITKYADGRVEKTIQPKDI